MADGSTKEVSNLVPGDVIRGETSNNQVEEVKHVLLGDRPLYSIDGRNAFVTSGHPFKTKSGWKSIDPAETLKEGVDLEVSKLEIGDEIITQNGFEKVNSIVPKNGAYTTVLYNPVLDGDHTYYANGLLVHNKIQLQLFMIPNDFVKTLASFFKPLMAFAASSDSNTVVIYDGNIDTGTLLAEVPANEYRPDVNGVFGISGNHGFTWSVPQSLYDGNPHTLSFYGTNVDDAGKVLELDNSPATIQCSPVNTAPTVPSISCPANNSFTNTSLSVSFTSFDSQGNNLRYLIDWDGNGTVDEYVPAGAYVSSGTQQSSSRSWSTTGQKTVIVSAQDDQGAVSGNATCSFNLVDAPVTPSTCSDPAANNYGGALPCTYTTDTAPTGFLDGADCNQFNGWTYDPDTSSASNDVHFYANGPAGSGVFVGSITANTSRPDVNAAFGISGNHGFSLPTPPSLKDNQAHSIYAYGMNTNSSGSNFQLYGTPKSITCAPVTTPVTGSCGTTNNACNAGSLSDTADSSTNYLWSCMGANGGADASCSIAKPVQVSGTCGTTNNACTAGTLSDTADSSTDYLWSCMGTNGGGDALCSIPKAVPVTGTCGTTNNSCTSGSLSDTADSSTNYLWSCMGANGGGNATCSIANQIPTISIISPIDGSQFSLGDSVDIRVSANDSDGAITKVEFFSDSIKIGETSSSPYHLVISSFPLGTHVLYARVTDNLGASRNSAVVSLSINDSCSFFGLFCPPSVSLTANPTTVSLGGNTVLNWNVSGASSCSGSSVPFGAWNDSSITTSGSVSLSPVANTVYILTCINANGQTGDSVSITVTPSTCSDANASNNGAAGVCVCKAGYYLVNGVCSPDSLIMTNGTCGTTNNACAAGTLSDTADSSTDYLWSCNGLNGGTNQSCSLSFFCSSNPTDPSCNTSGGTGGGGGGTGGTSGGGGGTPISNGFSLYGDSKANIKFASDAGPGDSDPKDIGIATVGVPPFSSPVTISIQSITPKSGLAKPADILPTILYSTDNGGSYIESASQLMTYNGSGNYINSSGFIGIKVKIHFNKPVKEAYSAVFQATSGGQPTSTHTIVVSPVSSPSFREI